MSANVWNGIPYETLEAVLDCKPNRQIKSILNELLFKVWLGAEIIVVFYLHMHQLQNLLATIILNLLANHSPLTLTTWSNNTQLLHLPIEDLPVPGGKFSCGSCTFYSYPIPVSILILLWIICTYTSTNCPTLIVNYTTQF